MQNFLPSRVPSNLDFASNTLGAFIGAAAGLRWGRDLLDGGRLHAWRERRFLTGLAGDRGLLLVALWLLTQLNPETFLFGNGNLRGLLDLPAALDFEAGRFIELEMVTVAAQTLAIALIGSRLAANHPVLLPLAMLGAAMLIKSFAMMLLMQSVQGFAWMTPGTLGGLALGVISVGRRAQRVPSGEQQALAAHGADARHRARQPDARQSLSRKHPERLAAGPLSQLQRPDAAGFVALAFPGTALADALKE